jgi:hypothetical protein
MPFITQGKTNVKYLAVVLIVAILAGAGIFLCQRSNEQNLASSQEESTFGQLDSGGIQAGDKIKPEFQAIPGEDSGITAIRKYYYAIVAGNLAEAKSMREDPEDDFDELNGGALVASPRQFEKMGEDRYRFMLDFQDHNSDSEVYIYRVTIDLIGNKLKLISSEEMTSDMVMSGDITVFSKIENDKSYFVVSRNGKEEIIDGRRGPTGEADMDLFAGDISISSDGRYATVGEAGWEGYLVNVYDLQAKKNLCSFESPISYGFAGNNYFYACAVAGMNVWDSGEILELSKPEIIYSAVGKDGCLDRIICSYDGSAKKIKFDISGLKKDCNSKNEEPADKIVQFSIEDQTVKESAK